MLFLFPKDYFDAGKAEDFYQEELEIVRSIGADALLLDFDAVSASSDPYGTGYDGYEAAAVWRGWQMPVEVYAAFHVHSAEHGVRLITSPEQYAGYHELSLSYSRIEGSTPKTVFVSTAELSPAAVRNAMSELGCPKVFLKDSVKGAYDHPCVLEFGFSDEQISAELNRLVSDRGDAISSSIAVREFVELHGETRFVVIDGNIVPKNIAFC